MSRILFLYATSNSGHQKAASAIVKSLRQIAPHIETRQLGFFTHHYPRIGPFLFKMYVEVMRSIPETWNYLYDSPNVVNSTSELRQFFNSINIPKLQDVMREYKPQLVVCTQAVPAGFIAAEKERGRIPIPFFVTITDFVANPYWPDRHVDGYFVPDEEIRESLVKRGIPGDRIRVTGIPIDSGFYHKTPKSVVRRKLHLRPQAPTMLIMGGTQGLGRIDEAIDRLIAMRHIQCIVVTGDNKHLYRQLKKRCETQRNLLVLGYVKNIARLMDAADLLISKPGGLTSAEAMVKGLPIIMLSPLPGQEERNAAFLSRNGIAERCDDIDDLPRIVESFLSDPARFRRFQANSLNKGRPFASLEIANHLLRYVP